MASRTSSSVQLIQMPLSRLNNPAADQPADLSVPKDSDRTTLETLGDLESETTLDARESSLQAWLAVLGAFFYLFATYGFMQSIGTIQSYLQLHQLSAYTSSEIGWITGVYTALALFLGIQTGPLFDAYGSKHLGPIGCAIYLPVFFLLAECTQYWQFMLTLGLLGGIGAAIISTIGVAVVGRWFSRRRGVAMGTALCGSAIGGVVMPLMLRSILPALGWTWSLRIVGFLMTAVLVAGSLCLRQPLPERERARSAGLTLSETKQRKTVALNFIAMTSSATFVFITIGIFVLEFAIFSLTGILPTYATVANFPAETGYSLVAVTNACSCFGRVLPGIAGDRFGHFNVLLCMIITTATITAVIFVPFGSSSLGALYAFSALWGLGSGSFISLTPVCMGKTCDADEYGRYYGTMYFFVSFALLVAVPTGGQILGSFGTKALGGLYVGVVLLGGLCFLMARQLLHGNKKFVLRAIL